MAKSIIMAKIRNLIISLFLILFCCNFCLSQSGLEQVFLSQVGVREKTGKNDGPEVESYLKAVGLGKGYAWCAAFVKWCFDQTGIKTTITAWSPSAHNSKNIVYHKSSFFKEPQSGDVFTIYYPSLKRIGHTGFFYERVSEKIYKTVEGNTNAAGSREGDGVYIKYRSFNATNSITRWN